MKGQTRGASRVETDWRGKPTFEAGQAGCHPQQPLPLTELGRGAGSLWYPGPHAAATWTVLQGLLVVLGPGTFHDASAAARERAGTPRATMELSDRLKRQLNHTRHLANYGIGKAVPIIRNSFSDPRDGTPEHEVNPWTGSSLSFSLPPALFSRIHLAQCTGPRRLHTKTEARRAGWLSGPCSLTPQPYHRAPGPVPGKRPRHWCLKTWEDSSHFHLSLTYNTRKEKRGQGDWLVTFLKEALSQCESPGHWPDGENNTSTWEAASSCT